MIINLVQRAAIFLVSVVIYPSFPSSISTIMAEIARSTIASTDFKPFSWTNQAKGGGANRLNSLLKRQPLKQETRPDHKTLRPTLCEKCVGSLTSPAGHNSEDTGDGAYGLSSLSEKTRTSNHLQMS